MADVDDPDQSIKRALVHVLPKLRRFCLAITASTADADDLCQSTCERAISRMDRWTPGTRLDSWLYRMAQNLQKNTLRDRGNRLRILEEQAPILSAGADEPASPAVGIDAIHLQRHLQALPQTQREILILICVEGYSYKECADLLDLSSATVTNRLFQARMSLREAMEAEATPTGIQERGDSPSHDVVQKRSASA